MIEIEGKSGPGARIFGNITCESLSVGAGAVVAGNAEARTAFVDGRISGDLKASWHAHLGPGGDVGGELTYGTVSAEKGARCGSMRHDPGGLPENLPVDPLRPWKLKPKRGKSRRFATQEERIRSWLAEVAEAEKRRGVTEWASQGRGAERTRK